MEHINVQIHNMLKQPDPRRWKAIDNPLGFVLRRGKPVIHPIVTTFEEFNDEQKRQLLHIKSIVVDKIGECELSVFGSQVKGNWDEESDYDIVVHKRPSSKDMDYLKKYNYGVPVDMGFSHLAPFEKQVKF